MAEDKHLPPWRFLILSGLVHALIIAADCCPSGSNISGKPGHMPVKAYLANAGGTSSNSSSPALLTVTGESTRIPGSSAAWPDNSRKPANSVARHARPDSGSSVSGKAAGGMSGAIGEGSPEGLDADAVRRYRLSLAGEMRKQNKVAFSGVGWQGVMEFAIVASPGLPAVVRLIRGSGLAARDRQVLAEVQDAAGRLGFPEGLSRQDEIVLPLELHFFGED